MWTGTILQTVRKSLHGDRQKLPDIRGLRRAPGSVHEGSTDLEWQTGCRFSDVGEKGRQPDPFMRSLVPRAFVSQERNAERDRVDIGVGVRRVRPSKDDRFRLMIW